MIHLRTLFAILALFAVPIATHGDAPHSPPLHEIPDRVFKVADHGLVVGGQADNTKAVQAAIGWRTARS